MLENLRGLGCFEKLKFGLEISAGKRRMGCLAKLKFVFKLSGWGCLEKFEF